MIRSLYYHGDENLAADLTRKQLRAARADPAGVLWVDLWSLDDEAGQVLSELFGVHPLYVEACRAADQRPRLEDLGAYAFVVLRLPGRGDSHGGHAPSAEVDLFVGANYLVTCHLQPVPALEALRSAALRDSRLLASGADCLAGHSAAALAGEARAVVGEAASRVESLGLSTEKAGTGDACRQLTEARLDLGRWRRQLLAQQAVLRRLGAESVARIRPEARPYFRAAMEATCQAVDLTDEGRERAHSALEARQAEAALRLERSLWLLAGTVLVLLPVAVVAAVFAMNFTDLPLAAPGGWHAVVAAMAVLAVVLLAGYGLGTRR
jgi:magnesium transporter